MEWPKITAETPIDEVQRIHRIIWQYVVENGEKPETPYFTDCAACEYIRCLTEAICCESCPIDWGELGECTDTLSIFYMWHNTMKSRTPSGDIMAKRLAAVIRDVKFKK